MNQYRDRQEAGKVLAEQLKAYAYRPDVLILALPRGGVPVAYEIADILHAPLDVFIVRKLGVPHQEELAMGAIASGNITVFNPDIIQNLRVSKTAIEDVIETEKKELARREKNYRGNKPFPYIKNKTIILVDDGIATGATIRAAIKALRESQPARIVVAVPVAEQSICEKIEKLADEIICPMRPKYFYAVGAWYQFFDQTSDEEVHSLLNKNNERGNQNETN